MRWARSSLTTMSRPGRVAVEPMDDARPVLAGHRRERVVMELDRVDQRPCPVALGGMRDHPRRLVDDRERLVLVDDVDRDVLGDGCGVEELGQPDADDVARAHLVRGLDRAAVHVHGLGLDDPLDHAPGIVGEPAGKVGVDPPAVGARLDLEFLGRFREGSGPHARTTRSANQAADRGLQPAAAGGSGPSAALLLGCFRLGGTGLAAGLGASVLAAGAAAG